MAAVATPGPSVVTQKTSHPFTCITCSIAFRSSELQRTHMRSDWHRYNLKRRVASLPPLSSEVFAEKVLSAQASSRAAADKAAFTKHCEACNKTYFSENAFKNHLGSQRHRMLEAVSSAAAPDDVSVSSIVTSAVSLGGDSVTPETFDDPAVAAEFQDVINSMREAKMEEMPVTRRPSRPHHSVDSENHGSLKSDGTATPSNAGTAASTAMPINRCLFCNFDSKDLIASLGHMGKFHGLFIPEKEYLDDLEGLISYLQAKVTENFECISCHKLKNTVPAVQTHMIDKSHCRIAFDTEEEQLEIGQFYDFRSTYSDEEEEDDSESEPDTERQRGVKLGAARSSKMDKADDGDEEEGDWEDEESEESDEDGSITPTKRNQRHNAMAYEVDGELIMPSGRAAGHRSGVKFYKQNLHRYPTAEEREEQKLLTEGAHDAEEGAAENVETALAQRKAYEANRSQLVSRAEGGTGMRGVTDQARRNVKVQEKRERRSGEKAEQKRLWQMQRNRGKTGTGATGKRAIIHRDLFA